MTRTGLDGYVTLTASFAYQRFQQALLLSILPSVANTDLLHLISCFEPVNMVL